MTAGNLKRLLFDEPSVPVEVAGRAVGISRNAAYVAVRRGELPSIRFGGRISVPTAPLRKLLGMEDAKTSSDD